MRGISVCSRSLRSGLVLVLVALLASPVTALVGLPSAAADTTRVPPVVPADRVPLAPWLGWIDAAPLDVVEAKAPLEAERFGASPFPLPTELPRYAAADDAERRDAWRSWLVATALAGARSGPGSFFGGSAAPEAANGTATTDFGSPRALQSLWSLESHGVPRALHHADAEGATFVVTDRAILKFPTPGAAPAWMVKPGGSIGHTATTDANGDGVLDLVIGLMAYYGDDEPSLVVIDGSNGAVLFTGLEGERQLYLWTITDTNGDGTDEVLGLDAREHMVVYALDGTSMRDEALPEAPTPPPVSLPFVYFRLYHQAFGNGGFTDADGDGVQDLVAFGGYDAWLSAVIVGQQAEVATLTAYSGATGLPLWQAVVNRPAIGYSFVFPVAAGDLDGDGRGDVLVQAYELSFAPAFYIISMKWRVYSGVSGALLAEDGETMVCSLTCLPQIPAPRAFMPMEFADLDGDGAEEVVGLGWTCQCEEEPERITLTFEARGMPTVPGGAPEVLYTHELFKEVTDGDATISALRDLDGDGTQEALVLAMTAERTTEGALTNLQVHQFVVTPEAAKGGPAPDLYGFWDADANGQTYAWSVRDDRWGPVDADGARIGEGFRLIISMVPLIFHDHTKDKVPDLLLRKSMGYMWVDGRSGKLLDDVVRPIEVYLQGVYPERGRLFVLERDYGRDDFAFVDLEDGSTAWRATREELDANWIYRMVDVTGDGRLDVVTRKYDYSFEAGEGPLGFTEYSFNEENKVAIRDMTDNELVWEADLQDGWLSFGDVLRARPGDEILVERRNDETDARSLEMQVPGEEEPKWTYNMGTGGWISGIMDGYVLLRGEQEGVVFEILSGESGEVVSSYALPADTSTQQTFFTHVNRDRFPDLVSSSVEELGAEDLKAEVVFYDWANEFEIARFTLASDGEERFRRIEAGLYLYAPAVGFASTEVGDWDADGYTDFAFREADKALVRSTKSGEILALAPGSGTFQHAEDLNGDGRLEVGLVTDRGRLRFFAYEPKILSIDAEDESGVRVVTAVNGTETHEASEGFFTKHHEKGLPAPGFGLALALLAVAVYLVRRRA